MQTDYVTTRPVHAYPMRRGEYNIMRGWDLPKDEDGADEGFLVHHLIDISNCEGYKGYIQWLPKDVFNSIYIGCAVSTDDGPVTPRRQIDTHKVNPVNDAIEIFVVDNVGPGNAHHVYVCEGKGIEPTVISFQKGPIAENGVNGLTHEVLLAIIIDRLQCFQEGSFKCRENAIALTKIEEGLLWLQKRTLDRMRRGVEGYNKV